MKNPNGFGTVTKLKGSRRRPWIIKEGRSGKQRVIGYAETREEGLILLSKYNQNPWNVDAEKITFQQLFDLWLEKRAVKLSRSNRDAMRSAYKHCMTLAQMQYNRIKSFQMQDCVDTCGHGHATQSSIKNLFKHLDRFALELDIIQKQCSTLITIDPTPETTRGIFSSEEIQRLWQRQEEPWVDSVLFFLYTGFRISEMLDLRTANIDFAEQTMQGGTKTAAGKNRIVPIHSKILNIVQRRFSLSKRGYLFENKGKPVSKTQYRFFWSNIMNASGMKHTPHECRHTFRSRLDSAGANAVCIDRMMGHKSIGTGERIYTHKTIEELRFAIELITD